MKTFLKNKEAQKQLEYYITDQFKTNKVISGFNFFFWFPRQNLYITAIKQRLVFVYRALGDILKSFVLLTNQRKTRPSKGGA